MRDFIFFTFFGVLLIGTSCRQEHIVELIQDDKGFPVLQIPGDQLESPLILAGGAGQESSAIWFETPEGIIRIAGEPMKIKESEQVFIASWKINNREITVQVTKETDHHTFSFSANPDDDILKWGFSVAASGDEYFTGLFERVVDGEQKESWREGITEGMDLHGQTVDMIIKPTLSLYCPFYLSSAGYGIFIDGTWPGKYDFCKSDSSLVQIEFEGSTLSGRIYISDDPATIVQAHSLHVGPTIVPPRWAFLPWRWRDNHVHRKTYYDGTPVTAPYNSELVEDLLMMEAFDIPCGVYWVDRPWAIGHHGYADFEWDPERFPHAVQMIEWIHKNDIRFLLWIAPWVTGEMMTEAHEKGFTQPLQPVYSIDSSNAALLDLTNPEACTWWQSKGIEKMLKQGVDGFKLDRSEETVPETRDVILNDGRTAREVRNHYPVLYVKTVNESCKKIRGDDFVLIPRAGYTGSARYSGFWGGDISSPPEGLRAAIIALQRSSLIGFPIWGSDIGGYWGSDLDREVCARWLAFGCFNPIMEFGPTEDRAPWDMDSEPHYDTELIAIWRLYAKLHEKLADYSLGLAKEARLTGMPPVRPLFLAYPDQEAAWTEWQNFLYGPDILVHAIWEKGVSECKVYLPGGNNWIDAWDTEKVFEGGQYVEIETPLHKIPVFIKEGAGIDPGNLDELYEESQVRAGMKPDLSIMQQTVQ